MSRDRLIDLMGQRFGRLLVISRAENCSRGQARWVCLCDCGNKKTIFAHRLRNAYGTRSCGCIQKEIFKNNRRLRITHGLWSNNKDLYNTWISMKDRCYNTKNKRYKNYGGRGISVCRRWLNSFPNFVQDMGIKPSKKHSLDRIDNDKNYCKRNCRWTTDLIQAGNTRRNRWIECNGKKMILADWERLLNIPRWSLSGRLRYKSMDEIINEFNEKNNS